jgi:Protein of unknown function (DUF3631)
MEESPWAVIRRGEPLDSRGLAQRLRKYGVTPDLQRVGDGVARGYTRAQFADAWSRYVVGVAAHESVTSVTSVTDGADNEPDEPAEPVKVVEPSQIPLVDDHPCSICDQKMLHQASIERGHCERCERNLRRDGNAA